MSQKNVIIANWNGRGINTTARRDAIRDLARDTHATIICLQETKLQHVDDQIIRYMLGARFSLSYAFLPAIGTCGGIIIAILEDFFTLSSIHTMTNTISVTVTMRSKGVAWSLTCVYRPQGEAKKVAFIEIKQLQPFVRLEWIIMGDFNLITRASDKNNSNINRRLIGKFR
jgi:exonuclease III